MHRVERGAERLDQPPVGQRRDVRLTPSTVVDREPEGEVVEQLVGDDHPVERPGRQLGAGLDAGWVQRALGL